MHIYYNDRTYEGVHNDAEPSAPTMAVVEIDNAYAEDRDSDTLQAYAYSLDNATTAVDQLRRYMKAIEPDRVIISIHIYEKVMVL